MMKTIATLTLLISMSFACGGSEPGAVDQKTSALESCGWRLTYEAYGQSGCSSSGQIGRSPSGDCTSENSGEVQVYQGCEQMIDWTQEYTCVCED